MNVDKFSSEIVSSASALYDGGWRSSDIEFMTSRYGLTENLASLICEILELYEESEELENDLDII